MKSVILSRENISTHGCFCLSKTALLRCSICELRLSNNNKCSIKLCLRLTVNCNKLDQCLKYETKTSFSLSRVPCPKRRPLPFDGFIRMPGWTSSMHYLTQTCFCSSPSLSLSAVRRGSPPDHDYILFSRPADWDVQIGLRI